MALGLYSKIARRRIDAVRTWIAEQGYGPSSQNIRRCRQNLIDMPQGSELSITNSSDFFGVSSCRDLLFHTEEHPLELAAVAGFLKSNDLTFLGFETDDATLQAYRRRFPGDPAATNLENWEKFEKDSPDIFSGMYMFWVQKGGPLGQDSNGRRGRQA